MKKYFLRSFCFLSFLMASVSFSKSAAGPKKDHSDVTPLMYEMLNQLTALQPYMVNRQKFESDANKAEITKRLNELARLSEKVMVQKSVATPGYRISGEALNQHIQHTKNTFLSGRLDYARWALESVPFACASCHTQDAKSLWILGQENLAGSDLEKAEFLYSTRNYEAAEKLYTQFIRTFTVSSSSPEAFQDPIDADLAVKKKMLIWLRVWGDLAGASKTFAQDLKNENLPKTLRELMTTWQGQMEKLSKSASQEKKLKGEKLLELARKRLPGNTGAYMNGLHPDLVQYVWTSGLLYHELNGSPEKAQVPELLYWLALVDLGLNKEFFFSLGNTYLRDCILQYPTTKITQSCYKEYELQIAQLYTGTKGTDIPKAVQADLKKLRAKAGLR